MDNFLSLVEDETEISIQLAWFRLFFANKYFLIELFYENFFKLFTSILYKCR